MPFDQLHIDMDCVLGKGAFSKVHKGRLHCDWPMTSVQVNSSHYDVAIKLLSMHADEVARANFIQEINLMQVNYFCEKYSLLTI